MTKLFKITEIEELHDYIVKVVIETSHDNAPFSRYSIFFSMYELYGKNKTEIKNMIKVRVKFHQQATDKTKDFINLSSQIISNDIEGL